MAVARLEGEARGGEAMDLFDVYVLRFDVNEDRATRALMQVFGLSEAAARVFVHSVPRVGKRDVPTPMAERYVRALHAVGAIVECRRSGHAPLGETANRVQHMSLPAPSDASLAGVSNPPHVMQDSLGIMAPLAYSPDMPQIPKAPRLPADLHHIRARKGPDSLAPNWRHTDSKRGASAGPHSAHAGHSSDPGIWSADPGALALSSDPLGALDSSQAPKIPSPKGGRAPRTKSSDTDDGSEDDDSDPLRSGGPLSPSPFAASSPTPRDEEPSPWYATATHQLLLAAVIVTGMALALTTGVFETDQNRTARAFEQAGIHAGTYEPAARFVAHGGNQFQALPAEQLQTLLDRLTHAGARNIWVADIQVSDGQRSSRTLLLDLPDDPKARRALFEELASTQRSGTLNTPDTGQRYLRVDF